MYTAELWVFAGGLSRSGGHAPLCCLLRGYYTCLGYPWLLLCAPKMWGDIFACLGHGDGKGAVDDDDDDDDDDDGDDDGDDARMKGMD